MGERQVKSFDGVELRDDEGEGSFRAVFSTLNVVDKDGDITMPGAFKQGQEVRIASWGHKWSELPVGKGTIYADADRAWVDGQFFLDTEAGAETYKTVKALGSLQEWSYGFDITEWDTADHDGQKVRVLKSLDVFEVSPVLIGAGVGTHTEAIKSRSEQGDPPQVADDLEGNDDDIAKATEQALISFEAERARSLGVTLG